MTGEGGSPFLFSLYVCSVLLHLFVGRERLQSIPGSELQAVSEPKTMIRQHPWAASSPPHTHIPTVSPSWGIRIGV